CCSWAKSDCVRKFDTEKTSRRHWCHKPSSVYPRHRRIDRYRGLSRCDNPSGTGEAARPIEEMQTQFTAQTPSCAAALLRSVVVMVVLNLPGCANTELTEVSAAFASEKPASSGLPASIPDRKVPQRSRVQYEEVGKASWYGGRHHGRVMAS